MPCTRRDGIIEHLEGQVQSRGCGALNLADERQNFVTRAQFDIAKPLDGCNTGRLAPGFR